MSEPLSFEDMNNGWSSEMLGMSDSFNRHARLLLFLVQLRLIDARTADIITRDFQQNTWSKIRDGE